MGLVFKSEYKDWSKNESFGANGLACVGGLAVRKERLKCGARCS